VRVPVGERASRGSFQTYCVGKEPRKGAEALGLTWDIRDGAAARQAHAFLSIQPALESMRERGRGRIVAISSTAATDGLAGQAAYAASKAGVLGMVRTLALELAPAGVTVNAVLPGMVETEKVETMPDEVRRRALGAVPTEALRHPRGGRWHGRLPLLRHRRLRHRHLAPRRRRHRPLRPHPRPRPLTRARGCPFLRYPEERTATTVRGRHSIR
jgi:NAD(P)-dependent dehydrogenase (short-subunit alcohol dehydrogenase family)